MQSHAAVFSEKILDTSFQNPKRLVGSTQSSEHSVYVDRRARGTGAWVALGALCRAYETLGFWKLVSRIFSENTASVRLHERAGFP